MVNKNLRYFLPLVFILTFTSCASIQGFWQTDNKDIEKEVMRTKKEALIVFTASDSDEKSKTLIKNVFTKNFFANAGKKFILYNADIVKDESLISPQKLEHNYLLFSQYSVLEVPHIVLISKGGDVYHSALIPEKIDSETAFLEYLGTLEKKGEQVIALKAEIKKAQGAEKIKSIDKFFENIYLVNSPKYKMFFEEGIKSDPKNESGLVGKFILAKKSLKIDNLLAQKQYEEAVKEFMSVLETKMLTPDEEQGVWCNIAYISSYSEGSIKKDKIIEYLEKAIKASPASNRVKDIKADIEYLKKR